MTKKILTDRLSEPLNGATTAKVDISTGSGNLTVDRLASDEPLLATGTLQYLENQDPPTRTVNSDNGRVGLTVRGATAAQPWFRLPWAACNGAYEWQIHLSPEVAADLTAYSGGGNVRLDLSELSVIGVAADSGGGNMDVILPHQAANLSATVRTGGGNVSVVIGSYTTGNNIVDAQSGAGNVSVSVPSGLAAKIHAKSGLGKVIVDSRFSKMDANTYQSPDYDQARDKVAITTHTGAGNITVNTK